MRVGIYARVSDDQQKEQQTIESQLAELRQFAAENNFPLEEQHIYVDDGHSGYSLDRPALDRLRDAARDGLIDLLLVHDPDRFSRKYAYQVLLLEEFQRWGVEVRFLKHPPGDTPEQKLLVQIQGVIAEYERARIMERTRRGRLFWARQGRPVIANVPFGYRYLRRNHNDPPSIEVAPAEAEVVRQIFRRHVEDRWSSRQVALELTALRVPTPTQKASYWDPSSVRVILQSEAYLGTWFLNRYRRIDPDSGRSRSYIAEKPREEWIPIPVPPLIDAQVFAQAQEILRQRQQGPVSSFRSLRHPETHLLRRLVVCASCGYKMIAMNSNAGRGHRYYWCRGPDPRRIKNDSSRCPHPTVMAQRLDDLVWSDVVSLLTDPELLLAAWQEQHGSGTLRFQEVIEAETRQLKKQLADGQQQRERLLIAYEQGAIQLDELVSRRKSLDERARELQHRLQCLEKEADDRVALYTLGENVDAVCRTLATGLETMSMPQKMKLCSQLIERVVVDHHTAEIHYRFPVSTNCNLRRERGRVLMPHAELLRQLSGQTRRAIC
ncbi:MAG: hypothetical protein DMG09_07490 [Acidobacteria bacterium]|nr:MAG: hypothetical protein DMG09_07490 [Acidobacteriota bacterium]